MKRVRYWLMQPMSGSFTANDEVDAVMWVKRTKAMNMLTHVHDQAVLAEAHVAIKSLRRRAEAASAKR
jgi:8-oxo-dGTP diphosphatase